MSQTAIAPIEHTVQLTNAWLGELREELGLPDPHRAYQALRAVLHALRDHLPVAEVADLGAQLPMLVRGIYYEGWVPADAPRGRTKVGFLADVEAAFGDRPHLNPEALTRAVFTVLDRHVSAGEMEDVRGVLPDHIRSLLP